MIRDPRLPAMMRLWQDTFGDSDAFVRLFFTRVYRPQNALTTCRDGRLVAMLYIVPYCLRVGRRTLPAAYICGVSTRPAARGQGLMTALMRRALRTMRRRGFALTTLIPAEPWLFDVYARLGYVHPIPARDERISTDGLPLTPTPIRVAPCTDADRAPSCTRRTTSTPSASTVNLTAAVCSWPSPTDGPRASSSRRPRRAAWCASRSCSPIVRTPRRPSFAPLPRVTAPRSSAFVAPRSPAVPRSLTDWPHGSTTVSRRPTSIVSTWR